MIKKAIDTMRNIKVQSTTLNFPGISLELQKKGLTLSLTYVHLRELYKIHYTLSRFYHLYQNKAIYEFETEDLILSMTNETFNTYKKLANDLLGSEYFLLLNTEKRTEIKESFDYVNYLDTYLDANEQNEIDAEEIEPCIEGLLDLYVGISKVIEDLENELNKNN